MQAIDSAKETHSISLLAALVGGIWGASLLWFAPQASAGLVAPRLSATLCGAALQWLLVRTSLQIARRDDRFNAALTAAAVLGTLGALLVLPVTQVHSHHRPLGAVTAAVLVLGASLVGALFSARLPVPPRLWRTFGSYLPLGLLFAAGLSATGAGKGWLLLGVVVAAGLRAVASLLPNFYPRWMNCALASVLLFALCYFSLAGSVAHWAGSLL
jgi:hypothetical protein